MSVDLCRATATYGQDAPQTEGLNEMNVEARVITR